MEAHTYDIVLDELVGMYLIKVELEGDENVIAFRQPALGDIAIEVCTPVQLTSIRRALIDRLEPIRTMNFRIPLVMAQLLHDLGEDEELKKELWVLACQSFKNESSALSEREVHRWMELIEDEIRAAGYDPFVVVDGSVCLNYEPISTVPHTLPLLKIYSAPVAFGPMGHSLSVITRNTFHEWRNFHGADSVSIARLKSATESAAKRYLEEAAVVESFLSEHGFGWTAEGRDKEREMISRFAEPASTTDEVEAKAKTILNEFVPLVIEPRLSRLRMVAPALRVEKAPSFMKEAERPIRKAYACLKKNKDSGLQDATQEALMVLATMNWKPRRVPEYLPLVHYQTVANVRNKTLMLLSKAEAIIFRHKQTIVDFEAFLIITALLHTRSKES